MSAFEAELRAIPYEAPAALRERVRSLGEPEARRLPQLTWRRYNSRRRGESQARRTSSFACRWRTCRTR